MAAVAWGGLRVPSAWPFSALLPPTSVEANPIYVLPACLANAHVQLQGAFPSKFVNLNFRYLMLGHNLMPVAPVCCNM